MDDKIILGALGTIAFLVMMGAILWAIPRDNTQKVFPIPNDPEGIPIPVPKTKARMRQKARAFHKEKIRAISPEPLHIRPQRVTDEPRRRKANEVPPSRECSSCGSCEGCNGTKSLATAIVASHITQMEEPNDPRFVVTFNPDGTVTADTRGFDVT